MTHQVTRQFQEAYQVQAHSAHHIKANESKKKVLRQGMKLYWEYDFLKLTKKMAD